MEKVAGKKKCCDFIKLVTPVFPSEYPCCFKYVSVIKKRNNGQNSFHLMTFQLIKSCNEAIPKATVTKVVSTVQWGIPEDIAKDVLSVDSIKGAIKLQLLKEIDDQCQSLCVRTRGEPSIPRDTSVEALESVDWCNVMKEMKNRAPDILDFISTVAAPKLKKMWMLKSLQCAWFMQ